MPPVQPFCNALEQAADAVVQGPTVLVGNCRLMGRERVGLGALEVQRHTLADAGRTSVRVAGDGMAVGVVALAEAVRPKPAGAVVALHEAGIRVVVLTGDHAATAERVTAEIVIDYVNGAVLCGDDAEKLADLEHAGVRCALVGERGRDCGQRR